MALSRHRALLMDDAIRALPLWFRKSCILWYDPKRQGLTNKDIGTDNWKLKNLMDKETCYPYNWETAQNSSDRWNVSVNKVEVLKPYDAACLIFNPLVEYHGRIKVTNLDYNISQGNTGMLRIYHSKSDNAVVGDPIIIQKDGIYDIDLDPIEGGNRIYFYLPGNNIELETPVIIEQLPTLKGDMKLVNFGKYVFDFTQFVAVTDTRYVSSYSSTSVTFKTLYSDSSVIYKIAPFSPGQVRFKISGLTGDQKIRFGTQSTGFTDYYGNGTYLIDLSFTMDRGLGFFGNFNGDCNVTVEQLPVASSCGRGRYLDTTFPEWALPTTYDTSCNGDRILNINSITWDKYNSEQDAAATIAYFSLSSNKISHKYKISGLDSTKYEVWFGNDTADQWRSQNIVTPVLKDGIYTVPWADATLQSNNNTACIAVHRKEYTSTNIKESVNITIEQVPEYEDALVFDGVDDYAILDGYTGISSSNYTSISRRINLQDSDRKRLYLAIGEGDWTHWDEAYIHDMYSPDQITYGDSKWYGTNRGKMLTRNLIQHTLCTPENLQYYSQWGVDSENGKRYQLVEDSLDNYKGDKYYIKYTSPNVGKNNGLITDSTVFSLPNHTCTLSFDACTDSGSVAINYNYVIVDLSTTSKLDFSILVDTTWKRYTTIITLPDIQKPIKLLLGSTNSGNWTLNIKNIKLEIGNKATPYEPALEDFNITPTRNLFNKFPNSKINTNLFQNVLVNTNGVHNFNRLYLGSRQGESHFGNIVLYSYLLFNRSLTTEEVQWVEENIIPPLPEELSSVYAEGYWKDYTFWRNTDIWRDDIIPDLFVDSGKDYKSVINTDYCPKPVGLYSAKGKTNIDTDKDILYDLSGNGNHIKLHNIAFNGMDGYGGFPFNENNISTYNNCTKISYNKWHVTPGGSYSAPVINGLNPGTYKLNIKITINSGNPNLYAYDGPNYQCLIPLTEGINHIEITSTDMTWIALGCDRSNSGTGDYVVELLPEYQDGLIFNGTSAYGITDIIDKEFKDYTVIVKRDRLNNIGVTAALDNFNPLDGTNNCTFILESSGHSDVNNYGSATIINNLTDFYNQKYIWMTPTNFCNIPISRGTQIVSNQILQLSCSYAGNLQNSNIVFYSLALFDKKLTPQQIEWFIKNKM